MFSIPCISSLQFHVSDIDSDFRYTDDIPAFSTDNVISFSVSFKDNYWNVYVERKIPNEGIVHTLSSDLGDIPGFATLADAVRYCEYIKQGFQNEGHLYFVGSDKGHVFSEPC